MMNMIVLRKQTLAALAIALMMLAGCSSTDEASRYSSSGSSGGGEDCSRYSNDIDNAECETRNEMRGY
jgi:outer membrane murein-binding lipoprotein Lpp